MATQVPLNGFDVVSCQNRRNRIAVAQIMKSRIRSPDESHDLLEISDNRLRNQISAQFIREYQIHRIGPRFTGLFFLFFLHNPPLFQNIHYPGSRHDASRPVVFQRNQPERSINLLFLLKLSADQDGASRKVDPVPCQSQYLPLPKACE